MIENVPNLEPLQLVAGDTAVWTRSIPSFPAGDGWALSYALIQRVTGLKILFSSSPNGNDYAVSVDASTTLAWQPGEYDGQAYVTRADERHQVWRGSLIILPNFAGDAEVGDQRSKAKIILDFIDASFAKLVRKQTVEATIEGVDLKFRSLDELTKARNYWGTIYMQEQSALSGYKTRRTILARFVNPT